MSHDAVPAATNMLAISFSRRDKKQASAILSDAIAIAGVLGCALAAAMFFYAPPALRAINGAASAELVQPAVTYVRWRCDTWQDSFVLALRQSFICSLQQEDSAARSLLSVRRPLHVCRWL